MQHGGVAQLGERQSCKLEAKVSITFISTTNENILVFMIFSSLAGLGYYR